MSEVSRKLDDLLGHIDDLSSAGKFDELDRFIETYDIENADTQMCVAMLSFNAMQHHRGKITSWARLVERVEKRINEIETDPDRIERLMMGLK
tara:strand:+ start:112 stop:390 length:279 start_codon:yes stop_codon:yes gene_type:complete